MQCRYLVVEDIAPLVETACTARDDLGENRLPDDAAVRALLRQGRDPVAVRNGLEALKDAARGSDNLMPPILEASRAYATLGEMCDALREVYGEYEEPPVF